MLRFLLAGLYPVYIIICMAIYMSTQGHVVPPTRGWLLARHSQFGCPAQRDCQTFNVLQLRRVKPNHVAQRGSFGHRGVLGCLEDVTEKICVVCHVDVTAGAAAKESW